MTKNVETAAADTAVKVKNRQVSAAIPEDIHAALEDHMWSKRTNMSGLIRQIVEDYAVKNELIAPQSA